MQKMKLFSINEFPSSRRNRHHQFHGKNGECAAAEPETEI